MVAFTQAKLAPGAEIVMDSVRFDDRLSGANLVVTGEGRLDSQTARFGKGPAAVARHARNAGIPVIGIGGSLADEDELALLFSAVESTITEPATIEQAISTARESLTRASSRLMRSLIAGKRIA